MSIFEIIIMILMLLIIVLLIILWFKSKKTNSELNVKHLNESVTRLETDLKNNFSTLTQEQKTNIEKWSEALTKIGSNDSNIIDLKQKLDNLLNTSNSNQHTNLEKLTDTVNKLDINSKYIDELKNKISNLNSIFISQKKRGTLGEFSLDLILSNILGENSKIWKKQCDLFVDKNRSDKGKADAIIYTNGENENIVIDAKFPLDKYLQMEENIMKEVDNSIVTRNKSDFLKAVNDKLKEIKKYFDPRNKIGNAIMFVPSEAVFYFIIQESNDLFDKSFKERIWICSPTTLSIVLYTILQSQKDYELNKNIVKVKSLISSISNEYRLFDERWEAVKKKIIDNQAELRNLDITIQKIQDKQSKLNDYDLEE